MKKRRLRCRINGRHIDKKVFAGTTLLEFLREDQGLTGTKEGCDKGECGACTVLVEGTPVTSCLTLALQAEGRSVVTIEGLADRWRGTHQSRAADGELHPVQRAFVEAGAVQCGFCTPGLIMSAAALIEKIEAPTQKDIRRALEGNLCRCTGYRRVFEAVDWAARDVRVRGRAESQSGSKLEQRAENEESEG